MANLKNIFSFIPEVRKPDEKKLSFNVKLKWTLIILGAFFILANIPLYGLSENALERFEYLAIILGTDFGSIISLGIGPIVMASIILQLFLGGLAILYMDEVTQKWGFGSGVSLFRAPGISWRIITSAFQFVNQQGRNCLVDFANTACSGKVLVMIQSLINKYPVEFLSAFAAIIATAVIFLIVVWEIG